MKEKSSIPINQEEISHYLKDIRKIKVMTPERERELAERMLSGFITEEEKKEIQKELLEGNLRFVITVSKQYQNQGLDLCDLIAKRLRFISYAVWWVRQSILQSLNENARTIRLPVNVVQELHKAKKELEKAGVELPEKMVNLPYTINLDNPLNEEGDTLLDILVNPNADLADKNLSTEDTLKEKLLNMLDVLDEREKVIIEDYFGLSGSTRTLEDIGTDFDLTKERVRQIKEKALRKLRNETGILFDYL
jgi:RNA polymerase primary sigma factor